MADRLRETWFEENDSEGVRSNMMCWVNRTSETADFSTSNIPRRFLSSASTAARATPLPVQFEGEDLLHFQRKA
jgi:hypothetical protein